jgi:isopenicillin-N N-acyltransferase-like protein
LSSLAFPRIKVRGDAYERGKQYGEQAAQRIRRNVEVYRAIYEHYAGWEWHTAAEYSTAFEAPIEAYRPHLVAELRGIADGARLPLSTVLALNLRTEIINAADALATTQECTALAALPEATTDGHTLVTQNWDWMLDAAETVVILEAEPDEGPSFITAVEAGLLAKTGMNSAGIGLVTNKLVTDEDNGKPGVPYHAVLRAILESETMADAVRAVTRFRRASSANYLIVHRDGEAINVEAAPGDYAYVYMTFPEDGVYAHTNHFTHPRFDLKDAGLWEGAGSLFRLRRAEKLLRERRGSLDVTALKQVLTDHFDRPSSVCAHPDTRLPRVEQSCTVLSIMMDLSAGGMWIADGNPCEAEYKPVNEGIDAHAPA